MLISLIRLLRSKQLSRKTKVRLYHQLILPVLLYGSESWTLTSAGVKLLSAYERRVLRLIFGTACINGEWRIRYNQELYKLYNHPDIIKKIQTRRLRWAGHVERMDDNAAAKIYNFSVEGVRRRSHQRARWLDIVEKDAKELRIPSWKSTARNREL